MLRGDIDNGFDEPPSVTKTNSRQLLQGELGITNSESGKPILGTLGLVFCVAVVVYNPQAKIVALAHIDSIVDIKQAIGLMCSIVSETATPAKLEVTLATGDLLSPTLKIVQSEFNSIREKDYPDLLIKAVHFSESIAFDSRKGEIILNVRYEQFEKVLDLRSRLHQRLDQVIANKIKKHPMQINYDERAESPSTPKREAVPTSHKRESDSNILFSREANYTSVEENPEQPIECMFHEKIATTPSEDKNSRSEFLKRARK